MSLSHEVPARLRRLPRGRMAVRVTPTAAVALSLDAADIGWVMWRTQYARRIAILCRYDGMNDDEDTANQENQPADVAPVDRRVMQQRNKCPQRANRSHGTVTQYTQMLLRGMTLAEIGNHFGVTPGAVRNALNVAGQPTQSRALLSALPEGCTSTNAEVLRAANIALAQENYELNAKLRKVAAALADFAA